MKLRIIAIAEPDETPDFSLTLPSGKVLTFSGDAAQQDCDALDFIPSEKSADNGGGTDNV